YIGTGGSGSGVTSLNGLTGVLSIASVTQQTTVTAAGATVTVGAAQNIGTTSKPTFASITLSNLAAGVGFASCVQVNANGILTNTGSACGTSSGGVTSVNALSGALTLASGTGVNITTSGGNTFTVANSGVTGLNFLTGALSITGTANQV